ncbi:hypothetical protein AAFF_G00257740 [Aldrovandia affinis]|uniref:Uncharacterized protein n=1 Tax=Aldrovandia affinis TaxID=143900 RepID=A0AAD7WTF4_9TELE|nr:hypothetical protein AAFF_G00257740 [Aldrovandia affinis]
MSLATQGRRDSLEPCVLEPAPALNAGYAVRRRFSGSLYLPPLSRRHSTQDGRRMLDLEALSKLTLSRLAAKSLDKITDAPPETRDGLLAAVGPSTRCSCVNREKYAVGEFPGAKQER